MPSFCVWRRFFQQGWFRVGSGQKCMPLTFSHAHSRCLLCCQGLILHAGFVTVLPLFIASFRKFGLPLAIRSDNGGALCLLWIGQPNGLVGLVGAARDCAAAN